MARREDAELAALMDRFVCVRVVQGWGLDLNLFQFDWGMTWAALMLHADGTIYGRYGSRVAAPDHGGTAVASIEGLRQALQGALDLHAGYPANKASLAGKAGRPMPWRTPEAMPDNQGNKNVKPADGSRGGCVHCHQAQDGLIWSTRAARKPLTDAVVRPWPMPDVVGLRLDPKEAATVVSVNPGSAAEKAGFKAGDRIRRMEGQPILSIADVQWVLQEAKAPGAVTAEVARGEAAQELTLALAADWREDEDFTWRVSTWKARHRLLGTQPLEDLSADEKKRLGLSAGALAARVKGLPPNWVKDRNPSGGQFKADDVVIDIDGQKELENEADVLAYLLQRKPPGSVASVTLLRAGKRETIQLKVP